MIFKPVLVEAILRGAKTQTRRPVKDGEAECRYVVGRDYAIQRGRTKPGVARIRITEVRREQLGGISPEDAQREGFKRTDKFFAYWEQLYGAVDRELEVWVISFTLLREQPLRLLGKRVGYTDKPAFAMEGEGEAVDERVLGQMAKANRERFENGREGYLETEQLKQRMDDLRRAAADAGVDISGDVRVITKRLESIGRRIQGRELAA